MLLSEEKRLFSAGKGFLREGGGFCLFVFGFPRFDDLELNVHRIEVFFFFIMRERICFKLQVSGIDLNSFPRLPPPAGQFT